MARAPHDKWLTIKLTHPHLMRADPDFGTRFASVMTDLTRVRNLGAGRIVQWDADDIRPWYARRFVPGAALTELLGVAGALPRAAGRVAAGVARGLAAMHAAELPHGGVAPGNVLVTSTSAQLVDGGLVRLFERPEVAHRFPLAGPAFAAPEGRDGTIAADLYALGLLLVLCARGGVPPAGPGDVAAAALPDDLAELARGLLDPTPSARPSAAEVVEAVGGYAAHPRGHASALPREARDLIAWHARAAQEAGADPGQVPGAGASPVVPRARNAGAGDEAGVRTDATPASVRPADAYADAPDAPRPNTPAPRMLAKSTAAKDTRRRRPAAARSAWTLRVPGVQTLFTADGTLFADGDELTALAAADGSSLWTKPGWRMVGEPREGRAVVAKGTRIALVQTATGAEVWRTDVAAARGLWARGTARLARSERAFRVHGVYEPTPGVLAAVGGHSELFGLDPKSGELLWHRREPRRTAFTRDGAGAVYLSGDGREPVRALDPATGELLWSDDAEDSIVAAVDRGWVLCGRFRPGTAEVGEYALRAADTGALVHRAPQPGDVALMDSGVLYILGGGRLRAFRPHSTGGDTLWDMPWDAGSAVMSPAPDGREAFLRGDDRRVRAVCLAKGTVRWVSGPIPARAPQDPVGGQLDLTLPVLAADDVVCVRSHSDAVLVALDRADGTDRWWWRSAYGTLTMVAPAIDSGFVFVVDGDRVRALTGPR